MFAYADIINYHRPVSNRTRMSIGHRAKQFAPFAALKGYEESVRKKERIFFVRPELAEEQKEDLDRKLRLLSYHHQISVTCFQQSPEFGADIGSYRSISGSVDFISHSDKRMRIGDTEVSFTDIIELNGDCFDSIEVAETRQPEEYRKVDLIC